MDKIRVLVADDHSLLRLGLISLLQTEDDIEVVGEAEDGASAVEQSLELTPDVIIMDIMMPILDGISATARLSKTLPESRVLILSTSTVSDDIARAIHAGAWGAVAKSSNNALLIDAIRKVASGQRIIAPEIERLIAEDPPLPTLTPKQLKILESATRGLSNPDIAKQFEISPESVKDHLNAIFSKLGAANRTEAAAIALRKHLLKI